MFGGWVRGKGSFLSFVRGLSALAGAHCRKSAHADSEGLYQVFVPELRLLVIRCIPRELLRVIWVGRGQRRCPRAGRAVTRLMRTGEPCAVLGGNFCLGFVSGVALPPPFRQGTRISDRGALWDSFSCLLGKVISYFRFGAWTASNTV